MTMTFISEDNTFGLLAIFAAFGACAVLLEKTAIGRRLSAPMIIIVLAIIAAHFAILPRSAPFYGIVWTYFVPLAIALFLIKADLFSILKDGGRVLVGFLFGLAGAALGALLGGAFLDLGRDAPKLAAVFGATYTGGSLNFAATAQAISFSDPTQLSAALAVDSVLGAGFILLINVLIGVPVFRAAFSWRISELAKTTGKIHQDEGQTSSVFELLLLLSITASICAISDVIARQLNLSSYSILFTTVFMSVLATVGRRYFSKVRGEQILATILMYFFFAMIGAGADLHAMAASSVSLIYLVLIIFTTHLVFLFVGGKLMKLNYAELAIASIACITGPPVAAAIALLMGWQRLVLPGILTGIFGYVAGTFVGVGIHNFLNP